jgi:hypothetical protein
MGHGEMATNPHGQPWCREGVRALFWSKSWVVGNLGRKGCHQPPRYLKQAFGTYVLQIPRLVPGKRTIQSFSEVKARTHSVNESGACERPL